jgi:hypothetical protein
MLLVRVPRTNEGEGEGKDEGEGRVTEEPDVLVELGVVEWCPRGDVVAGVDRAMVDIPGDSAWGRAVVVVAEREQCQLGGGIEELKLSVGHTHGGDDTARSDGEWVREE